MAFVDGVNARTGRMQLEEVRKAREVEMAKAGYTYDASGNITTTENGAAAVQEAQNRETLQLAQSLQAKLAANESDAAISDFVGTGDATYLQRALDNNAQLKKVWGEQGVQVIQNIDWANDSKLLSAVGLTPNMYDTPEKIDQLRKGIYKYYDGKDYNVGLINNVVQRTGALNRMAADKGAMIMDQMQGIANSLKGSSNAMEEQKLLNETTNTQSNTMNAQTNRMNAVNNHAEQMAALNVRREEAAVKLRTEGTTSTQKDLQAADDLTSGMLNDFGASRDNSDAFFKTDFSKRENYEKGYRYINKIEKLEGVQLSENDKTTIADMRQIISLADPASKLGSADTGIIDKQLGQLKNYLDDSVGGTEAKAAYSSLRNITRRLMSGQALTDHEVKANDEAMGKLGEQLGPTLVKLNTTLLQTKAKIESMNTVLNPYSVKIRLGADQDKLNQTMANIDKAVSYLNGLDGKGKAPKTSGVSVSGAGNERPSLDSIFGGNQ